MIDLARVLFAQREYRTTVPAEDTAIKTKHPLAAELEFITLLRNESDANTFSSFILGLRKLDRWTWACFVNKENPLVPTLEIGQTVTIQYPRFSFDAGKNFIIKRIKTGANALYDELTLFGPEDTGVSVDTVPNSFTFTDQTGVSISSLIVSAPITISGINSPATVSITGGEWDKNGVNSWSSGGGFVSNGDTIRVRHTSSGSFSTAVNTVLTVGGVSDTFSSTTAASFSITNVVAEGDSITSTTPGTDNNSYAWQWKASQPTLTTNVRAQASRILGVVGNLDDNGNNLYGHVTEDRAYGYQLITVLIGANDFSSTSTDATYWPVLTDYLSRMRAGGRKVAIASVLKTDHRLAAYSTMNSRLATYNPHLRSNYADIADYYIPFTEIPEFNTDPNSDIAVLADGVHPTTIGQGLMYQTYKAVVDAIVGNITAAQPPSADWFGSDVTNSAQSIVYTRRYVVQNMDPNATATISISGTGGRMAVRTGAFGTSSDTVRAGDVVVLEVTASASLSTARAVTVTIGSSSDTLTVTTAASPPATTTWDSDVGDKNIYSVLTNNDRDYTGTGAGGPGAHTPVKSSAGKSTGKWAIELNIINGTNVAIGMCNNLYNMAGFQIVGRDTVNGAGFYGGSFYEYDATTGWLAALGDPTTGSKFLLCIDADAKKMWAYKNGTIVQAGDNPVTGAGGFRLPVTGTSFFAWAATNGNVGKVQINAGQDAFHMTLPSGFSAWG